jgi:hypothetical protein
LNPFCFKPGYDQPLGKKTPEILGKFCHIRKRRDASVVDPPEDLASPIRGNVVFPEPLHKGVFCEVLHILSNRFRGQCRPLNGEGFVKSPSVSRLVGITVPCVCGFFTNPSTLIGDTIPNYLLDT